MEIERKFITGTEFLRDLDIKDVQVIEQYYTSLTPEVRYRRMGDKYYLTKKSEGGMVRSEEEKEISRRKFKKNMIKRQGNILQRRNPH